MTVSPGKRKLPTQWRTSYSSVYPSQSKTYHDLRLMPLQSLVCFVTDSENQLFFKKVLFFFFFRNATPFFVQMFYEVDWWQKANDSELLEHRKWGKKVCFICASCLANRFCHTVWQHVNTCKLSHRPRPCVPLCTTLAHDAMHHHTKFSYKRLSNSWDIIQTKSRPNNSNIM